MKKERRNKKSQANEAEGQKGDETEKEEKSKMGIVTCEGPEKKQHDVDGLSCSMLMRIRNSTSSLTRLQKSDFVLVVSFG